MDSFNDKIILPKTPLTAPIEEPRLRTWGNSTTMNLNTLILSNIKASHYFHAELAGVHSIEDLIDQIFYKVTHLEPWERHTRHMCGVGGTVKHVLIGAWNRLWWGGF